MAADLTYPNMVQRRQDGNMYVPSGKTLEIESGGALTFSGSIRNNLIKVTTTSVYTTTTLTAATHGGAMLVITTGTSLSLLRHRVKLPNSTAGTSGNAFIVVNGMKGTPTSNGIVIKPGTTTNLFVGTGTAGKGWKSSTRGIVGTGITLQSDGSGNYYTVGRANGHAAASTSLVWRTTG